MPYRSLVERYIFPTFDVGGLFLFGNTPEGTDYHELRVKLYENHELFPPLLSNGYIQFANPDTGDFDPVCFDMNRPVGVYDAPIVRIDHESILIDGQIVITDEIADSFTCFITRIIHGTR